jgi:hypothetical protein
MTLILSGTDGLSDVDGSASTPAIRGTDANTGIFFGADIIGFAEGGAEVARFNADAQFVAAAGTASLPVITTTGDVNTGIFFPAADTIAFAEGGTEAMRLDSAGNMGLGVTPSAWKSNYKAIQYGSYGSALYGRTDSLVAGLSSNFYENSGGSDIYISNGYATRYQQASGAHSWLTAASGTAGNTISFTTAMTLDASGNLGVGATSPLSPLDVVVGAGGARRVLVNYDDSIITIKSASNTANPETLRLVADNIRFNTGTSGSGSERARIDSSGNLLVGTDSTLGASGVLQLLGSMDAQAVTRCSAASAGQYWRYGADSGNSFLVYSSNASGGVYIANASTSWSGRSDERLKDIIEPITDAANKVSNLRAVIGKFKTDEEGTRRSFLIAQDVQAVLPEAVSVSPRKEGEDTDYLGVAYTDVIPLLVAAIKEQQAIITQLQADVAALKGTA